MSMAAYTDEPSRLGDPIRCCWVEHDRRCGSLPTDAMCKGTPIRIRRIGWEEVETDGKKVIMHIFEIGDQKRKIRYTDLKVLKCTLKNNGIPKDVYKKHFPAPEHMRKYLCKFIKKEKFIEKRGQAIEEYLFHLLRNEKIQGNKFARSLVNILGKPQSQQNINEEKHQNAVSNDQKIQKEEFFKDIVNMEHVFEVLFQSDIQHLEPYCKKDVSLPNDHLNLLELAQKIGITNERDEIEMQNLKTFRNESENAKCDCCKKIYSISNKSPGDHPCKACNDHYVCRGCLLDTERDGSTNNCPVENCNEKIDNCSRNKKYFVYSVMETSIKRLIREKEMEVMKRAKDIRMILEKAIEYVQYGFVLDDIRKDISNQEHPNHKNFIHELHEISCGNTNLDNEYHLNRVSKVFGLKLSEQKYLRKRVLVFLAIDFKHGLRKKRLAKFQNDEDTAKKVVAISSVIQRAAEAGISVFAVTEILKVGLAGGLASIGGAAMFIIECAWTIWKTHKRSDLTPKQKIHMYRVKIAATFLRNGTALGLSISSFFIGGAVGAVIGIGSGPLLPIFCLVFGCIGYGIGTLSAKLLVHYFPDEDKKRLQQHSAMLVLAFKRLLPETFERHEMSISTEPETAKKIYLPRLKKEFRKLLLESENDENGCVKLSILWQRQCLESHLISIEENKAWICKEVRKECKRQWKMIKRDTYEISVKKLKRYLNHSTRIAEQGK